MSEMVHHGMSGHPSNEYYGCDVCTRQKIWKLEAELNTMHSVQQSSAAVIVGYQEKFSKQETELNTLREELKLQKSVLSNGAA